LRSCEKNNPSKDITGVLLHSKNHFLQYLEGSKDEIVDLYEKIKTDERHTEVELKNLDAIEDKIFPSWHMGYRDIDTDLIEFNTSIDGKDLMAFETVIHGAENLDDHGIETLKNFFATA
jgi:hypothetical protein